MIATSPSSAPAHRVRAGIGSKPSVNDRLGPRQRMCPLRSKTIASVRPRSAACAGSDLLQMLRLIQLQVRGASRLRSFAIASASARIAC